MKNVGAAYVYDATSWASIVLQWRVQYTDTDVQTVLQAAHANRKACIVSRVLQKWFLHVTAQGLADIVGVGMGMSCLGSEGMTP